MGRSATNVVGNAVASAVVARWEGALDPLEPAEIEPPHAPSPPADAAAAGEPERCWRSAGSSCCRPGRSSSASSSPGLALNIVPGADMTFVIASAARGGRRDGIVAALGIGAGALVHIFAAMLGLSAILASSQAAFDLIKWIGAAYLLWIAFSLVRGGQAPAEPRRRRAGATVPRGDAGQHPQPQGRPVLPRLPAAIRRSGGGDAGLQILCLGLWFDFVGTLVNIAIALAAAGAAARLGEVAWIGRAARWLAATVIGALAVQLALASRRHA